MSAVCASTVYVWTDPADSLVRRSAGTVPSAAVAAARAAGARVVLNLAPVYDVDDTVLKEVDVLVRFPEHRRSLDQLDDLRIRCPDPEFAH